jgi:hypothetical protein
MKLKYFFLPIIVVAVIAGLYLLLQQKPLFKINTSQTAVIKEIRELNRLETAQFTIEKIIDAKANSNNVFQEFLYGDKILLIAHGEVVAGFDLSSTGADDVKIEGSKLNINLPPPIILFSKIDNDKTKVYDRTQGLLTKGNKDLESEARKAAESSIRQAACDAKILDQASDNGRKQFKTMFSSFGFTEINVNIPQGVCE